MVPFLSNLGLNEPDQYVAPSAESMPPALNPNNTTQWQAAVNQATSESGDVIEVWARTITLYTEQCIADNVFPFMISAQAINDGILSSMQAQRSAVVSFLTSSNLLAEKISQCSVSSVKRVVEFLDRGFNLYVSVKLRLDIAEAASICQAMTFDKVTDFYFKKDVGSGASVGCEVDKAEPQYSYVSYIIRCSSLPCIANKYAPSSQEYEKFILNVMYLPLVRMSVPTIFSNRLF